MRFSQLWTAAGGVARMPAKVALMLVGAALLAVPAPEADAQTRKEPFGDWSLVCDQPPGASSEQCSLIQSVIAEDQQNVGLVVIVMRLADEKTWIMRVVAPLGVLLPSRLGLRIDETDVGRTEFVKCMPSGCIAETLMQDDLLERLKAGTTATFIIFRTPEEGIGVPVSLQGFREGFDQLVQ